MKSQEDAYRLKEERARNEQIIQRQREAELIKNNNIKQMVKQGKLVAEERKQLDAGDKQQMHRNRLINAILEENSKRMEIEAQVAELERIE